MAPTLTRISASKVQVQALDADDDMPELAQQFNTADDYASYVVARVQQAAAQVSVANPGVEQSVGGHVAEETEEELRPRKEKRVKGRRRAANPHTHIEAAMRRQADLKSCFRTLARPLKQVLDEMARRTTDELDSNAHAYEFAAEHAIVKAGLQKALDERTAAVKRGQKLQSLQLRQRRDAEQDMIQQHCRRGIDDSRQQIMDDIDLEMLQIDRRSRLTDKETDDEDDVVIHPHHTTYRFERGSAIDTEYDSRSRMALEVDRAHRKLDQQRNMQGLLRDEDVEDDDIFTIMDSTAREAAIARRQGVEGVSMLVQASEEVDQEHKRQIPRLNKEATSLMELATLATKPPSRKTMPPPMTPGGRPSTAARHEDDSSRGGSISTRQRKRSGSNVFSSSPFINKRPHHDTPAMHEPNIKHEEPTSPRSQYRGVGGIRPHPSLPLKPSIDEKPILGDDQSRYSFNTVDERGLFARLEHERRLSQRVEDSTRPSPGSHLLASPFSHASQPPYGFGRQTSLASEHDGFRPLDFSHRPSLPPPPMPPTARPVNHFANNGIRFPLAYPPPGHWSAMQSPLVALPQGELGPPPRLPFFNGPPYMPFTQAHPIQNSIPPPPTLQAPPQPPQPPPPNQYGGPMLAPAAGPFHTPQPAFAQQMGRQEQNKRRNTEGSFPRFKQYHGPNN